MSDNKNGVHDVLDEEGRFIWSVAEYNGHVYHAHKDLLEKIESYKESFPVRDNDIYLVDYPKSGTHWTGGILKRLIRDPVAEPVERQSQMLEISYNPEVPFQQGINRRIINTHLRYDDMPPAILANTSAKMIQVMRNPADVAVSFFHHKKQMKQRVASSYEWDEFITKLYCDKQKMTNGTWFDYTCEWWTHCSKNPNYLAVFYEELKEDPVKSITKIAEFIEVKADKDLIQSIVDQTSFQKMKEVNDPKEAPRLKHIFVDGFSMYRKGVVGDWRNHFTKEQHQQFMEYYNQQLQDFPELHQRFIKYLQW